MGSWFKSNILQNKFVPCIWDGGVHGWRAGLKNRERWFDSTPSHQRECMTLSWLAPGSRSNSRIGDYTIKTLSKRPASGDPWHLSFLSVVLCHCVFILCLLIKYSVLWLPEAYPFLYISKYIETKTII